MKAVGIIAALFLALPLAVLAHGDEDHSAPAPVVSRAVAPRAVASSEEFEAVVVHDGKTLILYLDRFASNAPVAGAKVEIEGAGLKGAAAETSPGVYAMAVASLAAARHPLAISIETRDSADLLSATLDVAPPAAGALHVPDRREWLVWTSAGGLGLLALALWAIRRRKQSRGAK